jgi:hypothetical protein
VPSTESAMARNVQRRVEVAAAGQRRQKTVVLEEIHQERCARVGVLKKGRRGGGQNVGKKPRGRAHGTLPYYLDSVSHLLSPKPARGGHDAEWQSRLDRVFHF